MLKILSFEHLLTMRNQNALGKQSHELYNFLCLTRYTILSLLCSLVQLTNNFCIRIVKCKILASVSVKYNYFQISSGTKIMISKKVENYFHFQWYQKYKNSIVDLCSKFKIKVSNSKVPKFQSTLLFNNPSECNLIHVQKNMLPHSSLVNSITTPNQISDKFFSYKV